MRQVGVAIGHRLPTDLHQADHRHQRAAGTRASQRADKAGGGAGGREGSSRSERATAMATATMPAGQRSGRIEEGLRSRAKRLRKDSGRVETMALGDARGSGNLRQRRGPTSASFAPHRKVGDGAASDHRKESSRKARRRMPIGEPFERPVVEQQEHEGA